MLTKKQRIEELERRVRELEQRELWRLYPVVPAPAYPAYPWPNYPYVAPMAPNYPWGITVTCGADSGSATMVPGGHVSSDLVQFQSAGYAGTAPC